MPTYKLTIEYDGTPYSGWQRTGDAQPTIQKSLEDAVYLFCGERAEVYCAGRTDAGVHALGQVAHLILGKEHAPFTVMQAINFHLIGQPIAIVASEVAPDDFHARYQATRRHYRYRILNRRARPALDAQRVWHVPYALDTAAMQAGAQYLIGHHDFTSFRDAECQAKSPMKTLDHLAIARDNDDIIVTTHSRSFLHHQVRIMVGTLFLVGKGDWLPEQVNAALLAKDRARAGPTAPAEGLYLTHVEY